MLSETSKVEPLTKYGKAKNNLRKELEKLNKKYKINLSWLRIFYIYGHSKNNKNLWSKLIKYSNYKKNRNFKMSSGEQYRDYIHTKDLAQNIVTIALKKKKFWNNKCLLRKTNSN